MNMLERTVRRVQIVDSHTEGEPTRVVISGGPELGGGDLPSRLSVFRTHFDDLRAGIIQEPRGSEAVVGALLQEPMDPTCVCGVIFFNDCGYLGMCGHGTIGVVTTLAHLGRIGPGHHRLETTVGVVSAELHPDGRVSVHNIPSYRYRTAVSVDVPEWGTFTGDIAWSGNWFFLVADHGHELILANRVRLTAVSSAIRSALIESGITGKDEALIDHIELFSPPFNAANNSRNFVLCPGAAFDRSPCGTGTSAKMACLYAAGKLKAGELWRQEGLLGTVFTGSVQEGDEAVLPTITGKAWITAESSLLFGPDDPFRYGIPFA